ncbi:hypothetical protein ACWKSP_30455 [Micromonosporaceae bacterium Da 78-11]
MLDSTRRLLSCLLLTAAVGGCASGTPTVAASGTPVTTTPASPSMPPTTVPPTTAPTATATATGSPVLPLTFVRSGGIAGVQDQITIEADGTATVTRRDGRTVKSAVPAADLADLSRLLADPALPREANAAAKSSKVCSDGFRYELRTPAQRLKVDDCGEALPTLDQIRDLVLPLVNG